MKHENLSVSVGEIKLNSFKDKWRRNKKTVFVLAFFLCLAVFFLLKGKGEDIEEEAEAIPKNVSVFEIGGERTQFAVLEKTLKISAKEETKVIAESAGVIQEVNFKEGDKVQEGQILAKFEQNNSAFDLDAANSSLNFAQRNFEETIKSGEQDRKIAEDSVDLAEINYDKAKKGEAGALDEETAKKNLDLAEEQEEKTSILTKQQILNAQNNLEMARAGRQKAQLAYEKNFIKAPVAGTVVWKNFSQGDYLAPGSTVAVINGGGDLESVVYFSDIEVQNLKAGDKVEIICGGKNYPGIASIQNISESLNPFNLRYALAINYTSVDIPKCVAANKFVKAKFNIPADTQVGKYFLPLSAVKIGQNKTTVFVVKNKSAELREIKTGLIFGDFIEATEGLNEGEIIVEEGSKNLREGDKVVWEDQPENNFFSNSDILENFSKIIGKSSLNFSKL